MVSAGEATTSFQSPPHRGDRCNFTFVLVGVESQSAWWPTGTIVELWGKSTTQATTIKKVGTQFLLELGIGASP